MKQLQEVLKCWAQLNNMAAQISAALITQKRRVDQKIVWLMQIFIILKISFLVVFPQTMSLHSCWFKGIVQHFGQESSIEKTQVKTQPTHILLVESLCFILLAAPLYAEWYTNNSIAGCELCKFSKWPNHKTQGDGSRKGWWKPWPDFTLFI